MTPSEDDDGRVTGCNALPGERVVSAPATRYHYTASLSWGGDTPTAELEVEVSYAVAWGSPERRNFGLPDTYDLGSPSEVEDIRVEKINDLDGAIYIETDHMAGETIDAIIDKLDMDHEKRMLEWAIEQEFG